jgi:hypothetical protein
MFMDVWRNVLPPSSGQKSKQSVEQEGERECKVWDLRNMENGVLKWAQKQGDWQK